MLPPLEEVRQMTWTTSCFSVAALLTTMKGASVFLAIVACATGLIAARYWYSASKVNIVPLGPNWNPPGSGKPIEPLLPELKALDIAVANITDNQAIIDEIKKGAGLNKTAAAWTAASVAASSASAILGALAC